MRRLCMKSLDVVFILLSAERWKQKGRNHNISSCFNFILMSLRINEECLWYGEWRGREAATLEALNRMKGEEALFMH